MDGFYLAGYDKEVGGYCINSKMQGDCKVAIFVCESEAIDYAKYRNNMLRKYNTTDVSQYEHNTPMELDQRLPKLFKIS